MNRIVTQHKILVCSTCVTQYIYVMYYVSTAFDTTEVECSELFSEETVLGRPKDPKRKRQRKRKSTYTEKKVLIYTSRFLMTIINKRKKNKSQSEGVVSLVVFDEVCYSLFIRQLHTSPYIVFLPCMYTDYN